MSVACRRRRRTHDFRAGDRCQQDAFSREGHKYSAKKYRRTMAPPPGFTARSRGAKGEEFPRRGLSLARGRDRSRRYFSPDDYMTWPTAARFAARFMYYHRHLGTCLAALLARASRMPWRLGGGALFPARDRQEAIFDDDSHA